MKATAYVHVRSKDQSKSAWLKPGDEVPSWAVVRNEAAVEVEVVAESAPAVEVPAAKPAPRRKAGDKSE